MSKYSSNIHNLLLLLQLISFTILLSKLNVPQVESTRLRLYPNEEPTSKQVYNVYRVGITDKSIFHLKAAGIDEESFHNAGLLEDELDENGEFKKARLIFNSTDTLRKHNGVRWFVPLDERTALHVYDKPEEKKLASGPQVDQEMCGLHLDYMLHLIKHNASNIANSTELSIFSIMTSFDRPNLGFLSGTTVWPGDYQTCVETKLNVIRKKLNLIDKNKSDKFFGEKIREAHRQSKEAKSFLRSTKHWILKNLGPFVGYVVDDENELIKKHVDKLHLLDMRYCLIGMRWPSWPNSSHYRRNFVFRTAACLPETCDSNSLEFHGDKIKKLAEFQLNRFHEGFYIENLYCLPDENSELRKPTNYMTTVAFLLFTTMWFGLTLVVSLVKYFTSSSNQEGQQTTQEKGGLWFFLDSWCLMENIRSFLGKARTEQSEEKKDSTNGKDSAIGQEVEKRVNLDALEGFKVVSSLSTITSHASMLIGSSTWCPERGHRFLSRTLAASLITICPSVVDNFFVVTGIITAHGLLQAPRKTLFSAGFWLKFFIYRYIRIVPLYILFHWFLQSSFRFIGSGPFWDYGTSVTGWSKVCQNESWWSVLLLQANFKSPATHCNGVGWYLANDIQFSFITPIIMIIYLKKPLLGHLTVVLASLAIMANHILYYMSLQEDSRGALEASLMILTRVTDDASDGYVNPQFRCIAYLIGLSAGCILYQYEQRKIEEWPKMFLSFGKAYVYFMIYLLCVLPFLSFVLPMHNQPLIHLLGSLLGGTVHGATSIASAIFVLLLCTGHLPNLSHILSSPVFKPLANASLSTLLVNIPVIFYRTQSMTSLPELTLYSSFVTNSAYIVESFLVAAVVHIIFEVPLRRFLVKLLMSSFAGKQKDGRKSMKEKKN